MVRTSSGRKGRGDTLSEANLLSPLPSAGDKETTEPPDVRQVLEAIQELRAFIAGLPSPDATGAEALRQATENVAVSVGALRSDIREHADTNAGSARDIRETLTAIGEAIGDLAARPEAEAKALREMQGKTEQMIRAIEASTTETAKLQSTIRLADSPGSDLEALDSWRDDFIGHVSALLATAKTDGGVQDAGRETALRVEEALGVVANSLKQHGDSLRRTESSSLLTRKGVESLAMAFDGSRRECRLWRLAWVSPLMLLLAFAAGMLLESNVHWFYAWLSGR